MEKVSGNNKGKYPFIASIVTSLVLVVIFAGLSVMVNSSRTEPLYSPADIIAGMVFVFVLSMIVAASVWPGIIERRMR